MLHYIIGTDGEHDQCTASTVALSIYSNQSTCQSVNVGIARADITRTYSPLHEHM